MTGDETLTEFYGWILLPICVTAMTISFGLKPCRTDFAYKVFLYSQYFLFSFVSEILVVIGYGFEQQAVIVGSVQIIVRSVVLLVAMRVRARWVQRF